MRRYYPSILIIISLIIIGCVRPYPVYDLKPVGEYNTRWLFGSEYIISESNGIVASAAFVRSNRNNLVFDLEVINGTDSDLLVAPESFYFFPLISETLADTFKVMAIDPEIQRKSLEKQISRKEADLSNQKITNFIADTSDLIGDIADSGERTIEEEQLDTEQDIERHVEAQREENSTRHEINNLSDQSQYWTNSVLRKTTLKPNEAIRGEVCFPTNKKIGKILVIFEIENSRFEIIFDQSEF